VLGCQDTLTTIPIPAASGEASCRVFERHLPRSGQYFANAVNAGQYAPTMQAFPLLRDAKATVLTTDPTRPEAASRPKLLAPLLPAKSEAAWPLLASVIGSDSTPEGPDDELSSDPRKAKRNWVAFDLHEPRVHHLETWSVTYEGIIPTLNGRRGRFVCAADKKPTDCEGGANPSNFVLLDSSVGFCDQGVQGAALAKQVLGSGDGDVVVITEPLPDPADPYWGTVGAACNVSTCTMLYGTPDDPKNGRDLTVDASFAARRLSTQRAGYRLPAEVDYGTLRALGILRGAPPSSGRLDKLPITWDDLRWIRGRTDLPLLVKGVLRPVDALRCVDLGADGTIVSNHGGRQLDGVIPSLFALRAVVDSVPVGHPVLLDGGVRSGIGVAKAVALGARAVCIGRPYLWGLGLAGQQGVQQVLDLLRAEFTDTMLQLGISTVSELDRSFLAEPHRRALWTSVG